MRRSYALIGESSTSYWNDRARSAIINAFGGGNTGYVTLFDAVSTSAVTVILYDRLFHVGSISAAARSAPVSAKIISRMTTRRSSSKNICSVRHRPMPCA